MVFLIFVWGSRVLTVYPKEKPNGDLEDRVAPVAGINGETIKVVSSTCKSRNQT